MSLIKLDILNRELRLLDNEQLARVLEFVNADVDKRGAEFMVFEWEEKTSYAVRFVGVDKLKYITKKTVLSTYHRVIEQFKSFLVSLVKVINADELHFANDHILTSIINLIEESEKL